MKDCHALSIEQVETGLNTSIEKGLAEAEAEQRLLSYGPNELKVKKRHGLLSMLFSQFTDFMVIILVIAAVVSAAIGELKDSAVILVIVVINAVLGVVQEARAEKAIEALKKLTVPKVMVKRDGEVKTILSSDLVPGDLILLKTGDLVPADVRLIEAVNLRVDEAALTGESLPVDKISSALSGDLPVADRRNMAFMGTVVSYGRGEAFVVRTGMTTELGKIAEMIQQEEEIKTPLQKRLNTFSKWLGSIALFICFIVFIAGYLREGHLFEMFLTSVSLAVAAIPEGLPAVITISLALGAYRMVKRHAIIRKLPAVETLGSVSHICSDKTGTLTQNKMTVNSILCGHRLISVTGVGYKPEGKFYDGKNEIDINADQKAREILLAGLLCNDAYLEYFKDLSDYGIMGDPTEGALIVAAEKAGMKKHGEEQANPRIAEIPFDSVKKTMATVHKTASGELTAYLKGAPGEILAISKLSADEKKRINAENDKLTSQGLRTLAFAKKRMQERFDISDAEKDVEFMGLVGMMDLPRPEVKGSVELCRQAGISVIMITGDHVLTAFAVAKELGIADSRSEVMLGQQLEGATSEELREIVKKVKVFARVSPEHKLRIVEAIKMNGGIVAVTGDGVNDAPALKKADIGVAMGITGTDVSKEASDMLLTDDNFATIVSAVEEGRGIFENIRKFVWYLLSANTGEIMTMFFSILIGMPLPLIPIQILWINLVTDGLPALALSVEPIEKGVMQKPPRRANEGVLNLNIITSMLMIGAIMAISSLLLFWFGLSENIVKARTFAFTTLAVLEMVHVLNCRSETRSVFSIGLFSNVYLLLAIISTVALQAMVIYVPFFQAAFGTVALNLREVGLIFLVSLSCIAAAEIQKLFLRARLR